MTAIDWRNIGKRGHPSTSLRVLWGNRLAGKWRLRLRSGTGIINIATGLKKRLQRQWYGILKENALLGNFQRAPKTHYNYLPMKPKCSWCVVKIWRLPKVISSVWNTTVRGDESDCIATKLFR